MPGGSRNRKAGHGFERQLVKIFRLAGFPHVVTSRSESKSRDDQKIDLINKDEYKNNRLPYNVQAKNAVGHLPYGKILAEIPHVPGVVNVIIHNQTEKVAERFITRDRFVIMYLDDFVELIKERNESKSTRAIVVPKVKRGDRKAVLPGADKDSKAGVQPAQDIPKA